MPADTNTAILGLLLQGTGNNDNTWGDNLNNLVIQYIEDAIAGRSAFTVTTADVTLTAAQARSMIHDITGTLTGNRNVVVPNASKRWTVRNGTAGNFTLSYKTSSGSAVEIPPGGFCEVFCDGANAIYVGLNSGRARVGDGTVALPAQSFASDTDCGWYRIGADNLGLALGGSKVLDVLRSGSTNTFAFIGNQTVSGDLAVTGALTQGGSRIFPIGASVDFDGITAPAGWLLKYGQAVSRVTYALLFEALTTTATATRSNGSTSLTSVSTDLTGLGLEGAYIEGTGIATGTTIVSMTSNSITLSAAATGAGSITIRILPHGQGDASTTFNIPDDRGRASVGRDNMGGTSADRITTGGAGFSGDVLGGTGGAETHTLTVAQMPSHTHVQDSHTHSYTAPSGSVSAGSGGANAVDDASAGTTTGATTATNQNTGGGGAHPNVQPSRVANRIIFTGVFS